MLVADGARPLVFPMSASNQPPASSPRDFPESATPSAPKFCSSQRWSREARSPTLRMPCSCRRFSITLPTPGILRTSSGARNSSFPAGHNPQHAVGLGLVGANLGDQPRGADSDRAIELCCRPSSPGAGRALPASADHAAARCRSCRRRLHRWKPSPAWARNGLALRKLCPSTRDSVRDGRPRKSPADTAWPRFAKAWPSGPRICAPHRKPPKPRRARWACPPTTTALPLSEGRTLLPPRRRRRPYRHEKWCGARQAWLSAIVIQRLRERARFARDNSRRMRLNSTKATLIK